MTFINLLFAFCFYTRGIAVILLSNSKSKWYISGKTLLFKRSFRLQDDADQDIFIGFRLLKRTLSSIYFGKKIKVLPQEYCNTLALIGNPKHKDVLLEYSKGLEGEHPIYIQPREEIICFKNQIDKLFCGMFISIVYIPIIPITIISRYRTNASLLIAELIESASLLSKVKYLNPSKVYDFLPYESDSNINALILKWKGIEVYKLPSTGPLQGHNKLLVADTLVISSRYQLDELEAFHDTILIKRHIPYIPEFGLKYIDRYYQKQIVSSPKTIGFYSSASWLRRKSGNIKATIRGSKEEGLLIEALKDILKEDKSISLNIFLHPKEKKQLEESKLYYKHAFAGIKFNLSYEIDSATCFENVDLGLGVYSTILFERLFCGFKTLFYPAAMPNFPIKSSSLRNICAKEKNELKKLINEAIGVDNNTFFKNHSLEQYPFYGFKN